MKKHLLTLSPFLLVPRAALAHAVVAGGFVAGLFHPVLGLDHLLAMVGVGIISTQMGGRAIWTIPGTFVSAMVLGGLLGMEAPPSLFLEYDVFGIMEGGIAASVLLLGAAIAVARHMPTLGVMGVVAFFGMFHGFAHGVEIPDLALSWAYIGGFVLGTALLHITGVVTGLVSQRFTSGPASLRYAGAVMAGIGLHIILGSLGLA